MKILLALSLLVIYVSAKFTITKIDANEMPCNVTLPRVSADFSSHYPERRIRVDGIMHWDNENERFAIQGREYSSNGEVEFSFYQYYRPYNDIVRIDPRTEFVIRTDPATGVMSCHKLAIRTGFNYRPPGIPTDYTCIADFVQGWKDQSHNDGISLKACNKKTANEFSFRTATKELCFPVSHYNVHFSDTGHTTILEETDYYNWLQDGPDDFPGLPQACT